MLNNQQTITSYTYDIANRTTQAGNNTYKCDNNGNLLNDGASTYTYDPANRLAGVTQGSNTYTYAYNGLGDRLQQIANGQTTDYTLDLNAGLTQVLDDGTDSYTYGLDRISQQHGTTAEYYLDDALGSVRQLTDSSSAITLSKSYDPYGNVISSTVSSTSIFGNPGEQADSYIKMIYLRSRMYDPATGRFLTKDSWQGDNKKPLSLNQWDYVDGNPVNYTDPSGHSPENTSFILSQVLFQYSGTSNNINFLS